MVFEILPALVYQLSGSGLTALPVELIVEILRYLDPDSLLNTAKAYKVCKDVCLGDPILRRRLKTLLVEKKRLEMERLMNPAMGIRITRGGPENMFGRNVVKNVDVHVFPKREDFEHVAKDFLDRKRKRSKKNVYSTIWKKYNYRL